MNAPARRNMIRYCGYRAGKRACKSHLQEICLECACHEAADVFSEEYAEIYINGYKIGYAVQQQTLTRQYKAL